MGFEVNFNAKPMITKAQSMQDGGAGNLGYFEQEKNEEKNKKEKSIFAESQDEKDSFSKEGAENLNTNNFSFSETISEILYWIKTWLKDTFGIKI